MSKKIFIVYGHHDIEKSFNKHVLDEGILGLFDFFKFKKFIQETY